MKSVMTTVLLLAISSASAAEMQTSRDVAYTEPADASRRLDVYWPTDGKDCPIAIWIHGGGWKKGDKSAIQFKPKAFVKRRFVFVSVNYRFVPEVTVEEMTHDIAAAIRWTHDHATNFNGNPNAIHLLGHSAGAHLAALVSTDNSYLEGQELSLATVKSCVPVDTAAYDVAAQIDSISALRATLYKSVFGRDTQKQKERSPIAHISDGKNIPPFLILHVADRIDSTARSKAFVAELTKAGINATRFAAEGKNHGSINRDLGKDNDEPTKAIFAFLTRTTRPSFSSVACEGTYRHHLQGICTDNADSIFWSFTTTLVKTNAAGDVVKSVEVANHHGDLCYVDGKVYVAVNLGKFNHPEGQADSWVYCYDAKDLSLITKYETQEVFHGAGGIGSHAGRFYVVGGLPDDVEENYIYEYDQQFKFVKRHTLRSGHTHLGIQTAAFAHGRWWFGCYGDPKILLVADDDFNLLGRHEFDCSLGVVATSGGRLLTASGQCNNEKGCTGRIVLAAPEKRNGIAVVPTSANSSN